MDVAKRMDASPSSLTAAMMLKTVGHFFPRKEGQQDWGGLADHIRSICTITDGNFMVELNALPDLSANRRRPSGSCYYELHGKADANDGI